MKMKLLFGIVLAALSLGVAAQTRPEGPLKFSIGKYTVDPHVMTLAEQASSELKTQKSLNFETQRPLRLHPSIRWSSGNTEYEMTFHRDGPTKEIIIRMPLQ